MPEYFSHDCAISRGLVCPACPASLTGTQYQLDKYIKHTRPTANYRINSIFDASSIQAYSGFIINTSASGCVERDDYGRMNMVWVAGSPVGKTIQNGLPILQNDAVKVVLPENAERMHAFPTGSSDLQIRYCIVCGKPVIR
jgi:hypothetical protein